MHRRVADYDILFEYDTVANGAYAGVTLTQTISNIPSVLTSAGDWFAEKGSESGFNFTRLELIQRTWGVYTNQFCRLVQHSGSALDASSAAINTKFSIGVSGRKWWFYFPKFNTGTKVGEFTLEVWNNGGTVLLHSWSFQMKLIAT